MEGQRQEGLIAGGKKARRRGIHHHRVTHENGCIARASLAPAGRHRHQADLALKFGQIETDTPLARPVETHDARKKRQRLDPAIGQLPRLARGRVTAALDLAQHMPARIDELAVGIAQIKAEPPLAEDIGGWVRGLEAGELEHAFIHGRKRDHDGFAGRSIDGERCPEGLARTNFGRQIEFHLERPGFRVDPEPGEANRPTRQLRSLQFFRRCGCRRRRSRLPVLCRNLYRGTRFLAGCQAGPEGMDDGIDPRSPILAHGDRQDLALVTGIQPEAAGFDHAFARQRQFSFACKRRFHQNAGDIAGDIARLVGQYAQPVRAFIVLATLAPAGIDAQRRRRAPFGPVAWVIDLNPVGPPLPQSRRFERGNLLAGNLEPARCHRQIPRDIAIIPAIAIAAPDITVILAHDAVAQTGQSGAPPSPVDSQCLDNCRLVETDHPVPALEAQADKGLGARNGCGESAPDRPAAFFKNGRADQRLERLAHGGDFGQGREKAAFAGRIADGEFHLARDIIERLVDQAKAKAGIFGKGCLDPAHIDQALPAQTGTRRAIEILRVHINPDGRTTGKGLGLRGQREFEPRGNKILHFEIDAVEFVERTLAPRQKQSRRPASRAGCGRKPDIGEISGGRIGFRLEDAALGLRPVRPENPQGERRRIAGGCTRLVAQQHPDPHRRFLARAIDSTIGIDKGIEPCGRHTPAGPAIRQIKARLTEINESKLPIASESQQQPRFGTALAPRQTRRKIRAATGIGGGFPQHGIVARQQLHP